MTLLIFNYTISSCHVSAFVQEITWHLSTRAPISFITVQMFYLLNKKKQFLQLGNCFLIIQLTECRPIKLCRRRGRLANSDLVERGFADGIKATLNFLAVADLMLIADCKVGQTMTH